MLRLTTGACIAAVMACTEPSTMVVTTAATTVEPHTAHRLLVDVSACWFGGIWGDVQGEITGERSASSEARCAQVIRAVYGRDDHDRYIQLRAFEPITVEQVRLAIGRLAAADPTEVGHRNDLMTIYSALAGAQREVMLARRASRRITRDVEREPTKLSNEEALALPQLESVVGFNTLHQVGAGDLTSEAHVLSLMVLLERMRVAEELPVHLKPYVVAQPFHSVFGVPEPQLPHDAASPLPRGSWLTYLIDVASYAHHPVTDLARPFQAQHEAAVAGILEGIADDLSAETGDVGTDTALAREVQLTIRALDESRQRAML